MKNDDSFSKQIDDVLSGKYNRFDALKVCDTPRIFLDAGLQQLPILYTQNHLKDALHEKSADNPHWHGLSIEQIKKVPKLLESPVLLMDSLNNDDSIVAVLSLLDNDNAPVFATIKPNGNGIYNSHKTDSNFMLSIYGKEKGFEYYIKRAAEENKILYWNKEKSQEIQCAELLMAQGLDSLDSNKILHQTNSLVNKTTSTLVIDSNQAARIKAAREIKENMPNLSENERGAAIAILEAGAKSQRMSISEYMEKTFPNGIFGDIKKAENSAKQQGIEINGAVSINGYGENAKAVIYASKTADFSTWCHELSHIWQSQLTGELKQNAEEAFQVKNSDWQNSIYTFEDGHADTSAEAFAYGFEDFLKHNAGEMATEDKKAIFEKFADYMSRTYNGVKQNIKINEEIAKVYEKFLQLDDNILAEAEKAVRLEIEQEQKINKIFNSPNLKTSQKVSETIGLVSDKFADLASRYGYDIKGYSHTIDNFFVSHALKQHGNKEAEEKRGNIAITHSDICNVFSVYTHPDYIIFGTKTKTGNHAIVYVKNIGDSTIFVEDVRSGKKELAAQTLYKKSGTIDVSSKKEAPELYAHSDPESVFIVDVKKEFVNEIENGEFIFQAAYHGSSANFEKFNTSEYGMSGDGAMAFGYGVYVSNSETIARSYAGIQGERNLYAVEIPDGDYIVWDKKISNSQKEKVKNELYENLIKEDYKGVEKQISAELDNVFSEELDGKNLYGTVSSYIGSDKETSRFFKNIGYSGIQYPAGTPENAINYVIFDDNDITIKDHFQFQALEKKETSELNHEKQPKIETSNQLQDQEKPMENQNIEPSKTEFSNYDSQEYLQKQLATQMILNQEDKEQMEAISATMKSATKDFMDLNATPITENPFKNADPEQIKELHEQAEAVEKMQQEAAYNTAVLDENSNPQSQTDEEFLQEYKQKYPESSLSISEDTKNELENVFSQIDDYLDKGIVPEEGRFTPPGTPLYLKELGSDETAISLPVSVIKKAKETHGLSNEEIKNSLLRLYNPVAVFDTDKTKSENKLDSKLILTDEFSETKPIALAININSNIRVNNGKQSLEVQDIRSIHDRTLTAKNGTDLVKQWTENGLCRYIDDKKISEWSNVSRVSFPIDELHSDKNNILTKSDVVNPQNSDSVKQEENPSLQMEPGLIKKFNEMKKAIESREKQESQTAAEKTESAGSRKTEKHEKPKVDLIKKAAKDFISAIKNGTAPFLNSTEKDFGKISLRPAAIVNASNGLPFSGEAQLLAQIYYQQQKMEGEIVTTFEGAKESGTFIANKPESKKNFVLANKTEQQQKEIIQKTRYFMPEACDEPDKIYAHALQKQRPQKISDYRDLIRHFENIPNGQKEISDLRIRIAHEHLKEIQSRFAMKKERILTVDEINERKKILQDYFKNLPEKHRESEKNAFENTFGLTLNPEEVFKTNLEGNFKNKKFEDVVKSNEKLTDQANRKLSSFIQKNSMEDKKLSEILHEEYNAQSKEEKETSKKLKIEAIGISEPETYLGKYLAACNANAEFVTDEDTIKAVQSNLVKKLEENYRVEKYGILKEIGQQAQRISNETTSKIAFDKAHSNKNTKEKKIEKEIGPIGMGN